MSHLSTFKNCNLQDTRKELLEKSLAELGITLDYRNTHLKNSYIETNCDAAFVYEGRHIALGLQFVNENNHEIVNIVGDDYATGLDSEEILDKIAQVYKKNDVVDKCREQSWIIEDNDIVEKENGDIVITASRYV